MEILQNIIGAMNKEEARHFKLFAHRTNEHEERKDVILFDSIRRSLPAYEEDVIFHKLYSAGEKNSFYRLKNRLLENIGRSLSLQYFDQNDSSYILNNVVLSKLFHRKGQVQTAYFYLGKAEKKAKETESLDLLELIYSELILLSYETLEINPEQYINKRKENRNKLNKIQEIDDILASVIYSVKILENFSKSNLKILEKLQEKVNEFAGTKEFSNNAQLRFKIYHAVSRILLQKEDYPSLEKYLRSTFADFTKQKLFNKNNHDTRLQMLTYLINALFKNNKYDESLRYAEELNKAMGDFNGIFKDKYLFYYYNARVNNYTKTDVDKAIEILNEAKENEVIKKHPYHIVFIYLNLAVSNFDKGNFKEALKSLLKPSMHDTYKILDAGFRYRIAVVELIIRYELKDFDYIEHRMKQIKKEFFGLYKTPAYARVKVMQSILHRWMNSKEIHKDKKLKPLLEQLLNNKAAENKADHDIINYNDWVQNKMTG